MHPKSQVAENVQAQFFQNHFSDLLNSNHSLYKLANQINWKKLDEELGKGFSDKRGRPALPTRLIVGLLYLKHMFNESDESVVAKFSENPYWQFFCGYGYLQFECPCDASSLVRWRKRFGEKGVEFLLKETIESIKRTGILKAKDFHRVNVDTTVQEKAITYPTDSKLYHKMRRKLVKAAKKRDISLRQSYERLGQEAFINHGRYRKAKKIKKAQREVRRLKVYLGRVLRNIERKAPHPDKSLSLLLEKGKKVFAQKKDDKKKIYSLHAPEVECMSKGKVHKKYEFGNKVSIVTTSKKNIIIGVKSFHENPFDGHTLKPAIEQMTRLTGKSPRHIHVDKGYRGKKNHPTEAEVHLPINRKLLTRSQRRWQRRRSAIESIISHMKQGHRMNRNYLQGKEGDHMNALLSGCGFNLLKLMRALILFFFKRFLIKEVVFELFYRLKSKFF